MADLIFHRDGRMVLADPQGTIPVTQDLVRVVANFVLMLLILQGKT